MASDTWITGSMLAEEPLAETATSFDALPDEVLHLVGQYLWAGEKRLCDALSFFECSSRHRALLSGLSELVLHGGGRDTEGVLLCHASLMAPQSWAVRLAALRAVEVSGFGFGSVGRLLMLLPLWPLLEQLEIRMPTGDAAGWLHLQQLDELTKDLVFLSRSGAVRLSRFHYVWLGSEKVDGTMIRYNGAWSHKLLRELGPTAALWFMAERIQTRRPSWVQKWHRALAEGADLKLKVGSFCILSWLCVRNLWLLKAAGRNRDRSIRSVRVVYNLLVEHGARPAAEGPSPLEQYGFLGTDVGTDSSDDSSATDVAETNSDSINS